MEIVFGWLMLALLVGLLANSRGRSGFGYFLLSTVLSPLLGVIILLVVPNLALQEKQDQQRRAEEAERDRQRQREHEKQLAALQALKSSPTPAPASVAPAEAGPVSVAEEIERLGALMEKGLLTREEFDAQKSATLKRG